FAGERADARRPGSGGRGRATAGAHPATRRRRVSRVRPAGLTERPPGAPRSAKSDLSGSLGVGLVGVTEVLVYASAARADAARTALAQACRATGSSARLEVSGTGSLYQRLGPRRAPPMPDLVWWFGPFAARAAAIDGLLLPHQPSSVADGTAHD